MQSLTDWRCSMKQKVFKWTKKEEDLVLKTVKEAKEHLNMHSWVITNHFESGPIRGELNQEGKTFITSAISTATQEYEKMVITWKPAFLQDLRDYVLEDAQECVYHELIHGLTQELWNISMERFTTDEECRKAVERLTQRITRIVCKLISKKKCTNTKQK